jgi:peptidoglycan/xylan/chitin deacetylase (PgdA/CDA1 family)
MRRRGRVIGLLLLLTVVAVLGRAETEGRVRRSASSHRAAASLRQPPPRQHRRPKPRIVHGPHDRRVPILMYHVIARQKPGAPYPELYTPGPVFAAQMRALARRGYHGVTLRQVDLYWRRGYALPRRPVVISFDDGYLSDYTRAGPVLRRLHWPGVLNLEVDNARTRGDISVREVRALIRAGWEVDSHTVTHPDLTTLPPRRLRYELVQSRRWLRRTFKVPVDYFAYPSGQHDARVEAAVRAAGYRLASTVTPGLAAPGRPFELARIRVDRATSPSRLLVELRTGG